MTQITIGREHFYDFLDAIDNHSLEIVVTANMSIDFTPMPHDEYKVTLITDIFPQGIWFMAYLEVCENTIMVVPSGCTRESFAIVRGD